MADKANAPVLSSESNLQVAPFGDFKTMPCPGVPTRMLPPVTSNFAFGAVVPIPTLVSAVAPFTPLRLPNIKELLVVAVALAPIAVAFVRLAAPTSVPSPSIVMRLPVRLAAPALFPKNEL